MYDLTHVTKYLFKDKSEYKNLTDDDKEKHLFIINRKLARKFPRHAQFFNTKGFDKPSAMDLWYNHFIKERTMDTPQWFWGTKQSSKKEKSSLSKDEMEYFINLYDISESDLYFIEKNYPDELKEEVKIYRKFNKSE